MPTSAAMKKLLANKGIDALLAEPDAPEPVAVWKPNDAYNTRVRAAVAMLRLGGDPQEVRQRHGFIVLREAREIVAKDEARRPKL